MANRDPKELDNLISGYLKNANNTACDVWTRVINYALIANTLKLIDEEIYTGIKLVTDSELIKTNDFIDFSNIIARKLIKLKQQISQVKEGPEYNTYTPSFSNDLVTFEHVIGLQGVKKELVSSLAKPIIYPTLYGGVQKRILMHGNEDVLNLIKATITYLQHEVCKSKIVPVVIDLYIDSNSNLRHLFERVSSSSCEKYRNIMDNSQYKRARVISIIYISGVNRVSSEDFQHEMSKISSASNLVVIASVNKLEDVKSIIKSFNKLIKIPTSETDDIKEFLNSGLSMIVQNVVNSEKIENNLECEKEENESEEYPEYCKKVAKLADNANMMKYRWNTFKSYMDIEPKTLDVISTKLSEENFRSKDISNVFAVLNELMAEEAERKNTFIGYLSTPEGNIELAGTDDKDVTFISTLSLRNSKDISSRKINYMKANITDYYNNVIWQKISLSSYGKQKTSVNSEYTLAQFLPKSIVGSNMPNACIYFCEDEEQKLNAFVSIDLILNQTNLQDYPTDNERNDLRGSLEKLKGEPLEDAQSILKLKKRISKGDQLDVIKRACKALNVDSLCSLKTKLLDYKISKCAKEGQLSEEGHSILNSIKCVLVAGISHKVRIYCKVRLDDGKVNEISKPWYLENHSGWKGERNLKKWISSLISLKPHYSHRCSKRTLYGYEPDYTSESLLGLSISSHSLYIEGSNKVDSKTLYPITRESVLEKILKQAIDREEYQVNVTPKDLSIFGIYDNICNVNDYITISEQALTIDTSAVITPNDYPTTLYVSNQLLYKAIMTVVKNK